MRGIFIVLALVACSSKAERENPWIEAAKRCPDDAELSCAVPIARVQNLKASQRYYRDAMGFKLDCDDIGLRLVLADALIEMGMRAAS